MKKRFLVLALSAIMIAAILVGCGNDKSTTTSNSETEVTTVEESVEDTNASTSSDSGTLGIESTESTESTEETTPSTNVTWTGNEYIDSYSWKFPDNEYGTTGYTCKYVIDENTSDCITHVESPEGTMDFVWSGPIELGENASPSSDGVWLYDSNTNYKLNAWYGGDVNNDEDFESLILMDKDTWVSFNKAIPYVEGGYYNISTSDTFIEVTFEISDDEYKGYAYYVTDKEIGECYQFNYVEKISSYDDTRAKNVIDSIDFATNVIANYEIIDLSSSTQ